MKNLTISLDDEIYRRARVAAAEAGRSVTSVVREFLQGYSAEPAQSRGKTIDDFYAEIDALPRQTGTPERLTREEMYGEILDHAPGQGRG